MKPALGLTAAFTTVMAVTSWVAADNQYWIAFIIILFALIFVSELDE